MAGFELTLYGRIWVTPKAHLTPDRLELHMKLDRSHDSSVMDALTEIALNLRWSWNHAADELWSQLDPELWDLTRNPWAMLQTVSQEKLTALAEDAQFQKKLDEIVQRRRRREETSSWFQRTYSVPPFTRVAYFSMEFMLSDALPIYSGGLGNVAGDQLKAASDLGVPVIGVGLLYQVGYFRQRIDAEGRQQALYPFNDPGQLPIRPVRQANGEWLRGAGTNPCAWPRPKQSKEVGVRRDV
jgi:starch phosphorylase